MIRQSEPKKSIAAHNVWYLLPLALAVALDAGIVVTPYVVDETTWMHVEYGETILQTGQLPIGTETAGGYAWMHDSYLSQVLMALLTRIGGAKGLAAMSGCLAVAILSLLILFNRRDKVSWMPTLVVVLLVWAILVKQWRAGPQLASLGFFTGLLVLLQFSFQGWRGKWHWTTMRRWFRNDWEPGDCELKYESQRLRALWLSVPLFCLWSNFHHGFRAGLIIFWTYLACRAWEAICQRGQAGWGLVRRMALMGLVAGLATLVNPYGPWLYGWLSSAQSIAQRSVLDGPQISIIGANGLWSVFLMVVAFAMAAQAIAFRRCDLAQVVALGLAGLLCLFDARSAGYFAIATGFWMGIPLQEFWIVVQSITLGRRRNTVPAVAFHGNNLQTSGNRFFVAPHKVLDLTTVDSNDSLPTLPDQTQLGNNQRASSAPKG